MGLLGRLLGPNVDKLAEARDLSGLFEVLRHPKPEHRVRAIQALADSGESSVMSEIVGALGDPNAEVVNSARAALRNFGGEATGALEQALGAEEEHVSSIALELLLENDPPTVTPFASVLSHGNDQARKLAASTLVDLIPEMDVEESRETCFKALRAALGDKDPDVRVMAAGGLGKLADDRASKALVAQLKDGTEEVREACSGAIEELGSRVVPYLIDALSDRNANARAGAAGLLGRLGPAIDPEEKDPLIERLREATSDREAEVAARARDSLQALGATPDSPADDDDAD